MPQSTLQILNASIPMAGSMFCLEACTLGHHEVAEDVDGLYRQEYRRGLPNRRKLHQCKQGRRDGAMLPTKPPRTGMYEIRKITIAQKKAFSSPIVSITTPAPPAISAAVMVCAKTQSLTPRSTCLRIELNLFSLLDDTATIAIFELIVGRDARRKAKNRNQANAGQRPCHACQ